MATEVQTKFDVGGLLLDRPFKIRRLGHFGFNVVHVDEGLRFYSELLGFRVSDVIDFTERARSPEQIAGLGNPRGYFMRYGGDHHAFVLFNKRVREALDTERRFPPGVTINQITWQVGSLAEVGQAIPWIRERGLTIQRSGRDMPGSNWHTYFYDPDGHTNELYYGIEQIGWDGYSKPKALHSRGFREAPKLPQMAELDEVQQALEQGVDLHSGSRAIERLPASFEVEGIRLPRPFKIVRIGPVRLFVRDVEAAEAFYRQAMGFVPTEDVTWQGHRCVFLRVNTEHHSLALYPLALRERLGLSAHTTCMAFGLQLASYRQLRAALDFLRDQGVRIQDLPAELSPGIDYSAVALDPDGHAIQLYYYMEQVGWDGRPRPADRRRKIQAGPWPETLEPLSDTHMGEPYLGPWG